LTTGEVALSGGRGEVGVQIGPAGVNGLQHEPSFCRLFSLSGRVRGESCGPDARVSSLEDGTVLLNRTRKR
jgi:hypothetical protein